MVALEPSPGTLENLLLPWLHELWLPTTLNRQMFTPQLLEMNELPSEAPKLVALFLKTPAAPESAMEPCSGLPATTPIILLTVPVLNNVELFLWTILICLTTVMGSRLRLQIDVSESKTGWSLSSIREHRFLSLPTCSRAAL